MAEYEAYRDSGAEWLGCIPSDWKTGVIGSFYALRNTKVSDTEYPPLSVTMRGVVPQLETAAKTDAHDARKLVRKGDFVINSRSDRRGSCGISDFDGSVSLINTVLTPRGSMNPRYYNWLFHTVQFADEFYKNGHGIVDDLWTTLWNEMKRILIPVPSDLEQAVIAEYLDEKIANIDSVSTEARASIEEYKKWKASIIFEAVTKGLDPDVEMKDSGFTWIGQMPNHWKLVPNKRVMHKEKRICEKYTGQDIISLTMNGVIIRDLGAGGKMPTSFDGYQFVYPGELLMCLFDIDVTPRCVGRVYNEGLTSPAYSSFVLHDGANLDYYYYYYLMMDNTKELLHLSKNLRHSLTEEQLGQIKVPVPPMDEQIEIGRMLDRKTGQIDALIAEKEALIKDLDAYKKSLIFEVVTGKRKVV